MTDAEILERVRKAVYSAREAIDDTAAEVAIRGVARMLANNLSRFERIFKPQEPPIETLRALGAQIVQLTAERGELRLEVEVLTRRLREAEGGSKARSRPKPPAQVQAHLRAAHRVILAAIESGCETTPEIAAHTGLGLTNVGSRLSEMHSGQHFGGAVVSREKVPHGNTTYAITAHGRSLLNQPDAATYRARRSGIHGHGPDNAGDAGSALHSERRDAGDPGASERAEHADQDRL